MCRLYGFVATDPTQIECSLVTAQNALQVQSDRDLRGVRNADGWGIASWNRGSRDLAHSTAPAFADRQFAEAAIATNATAATAHVRAATVGAVAEVNTHPFVYLPWALAHNGTIAGIEQVATYLDLGPFGPPSGATDSELVFRWMINRMERRCSSSHRMDPAPTSGAAEPSPTPNDASSSPFPISPSPSGLAEATLAIRSASLRLQTVGRPHRLGAVADLLRRASAAPAQLLPAH